MRGFAGFGTTMVMVPLFSLIIDPAPAIFIAITVDVLVMAPLFPNAARNADWKPIMPMMIASLLVTPLGAWLLVIAPADIMRLFIAAMVIISALLLMSGWTYRGEKTIALSAAVGAVSGTAGTAVGIGGPPMAVYYMASGSSALETRSALNAMGFIKMTLSSISIAIAGSFSAEHYYMVLYLLAPMLAMTWVGAKAFHMVNESGFKRYMLWALIVIGVIVIIKTINGEG